VPPPPEQGWERIAVIGHSWSDGNTWMYLVRQALTEAGNPEPYLINAAAGGDTAGENVKRMDWAVLRFKPDLCIFLATAHNVRHMTDEQFEAAMDEMIRQAKAGGADVLLLFGRMKCPEGLQPADMQDTAKVKAAAAQEREQMAAEATKPEAERAADERIHRALARKYGCRIADMKPGLVQSFEQGHWLWESDRSHLDFESYRVVARVALDALGYAGVPVPKTLTLRVLPGIVTPWRLRAAPKGEAALDEKTVLDVRPDAAWQSLELPEKEPQESWWPDQVRQEGYAMSLEKLLRKADRYVGVATWKADKAGAAYLNTGGQLQTVWLNGKRVYKAGDWNGFHAGCQRIAVDLQAGANAIVIETGSQFALNITPDLLW
jgi:hypothetical protein